MSRGLEILSEDDEDHQISSANAVKKSNLRKRKRPNNVSDSAAPFEDEDMRRERAANLKILKSKARMDDLNAKKARVAWEREKSSIC